jgi:hypothetical protein
MLPALPERLAETNRDKAKADTGNGGPDAA